MAFSRSLLLAITLAICLSKPTEANTHERMALHKRDAGNDMTDFYLDTMPATNDTLLELVGNDAMDENYYASDVEPEEGHLWKRAMGPAWTGKSVLKTNKLKSQVSAMQITVTGLNSVLIIDKAENNPLQIKANGKYPKHPGWVQWLNLKTGKSIPLDAQTNSFCAGGSWLSNGTMVNIGGNPAVSKASYYDGNGIMGVRIFDNCNDNGCTIKEWPNTVRLAGSRWYPGVVRITDGSVLIMGGMTEGGFNNARATDNPSYEFFPTKSINNGLALHSNFLASALNSNLFPVMYLLPSGRVYVAANTINMIFNYATGAEMRLPDMPNGVRITYPFTAASALLPLTVANNWTPEIMFCGGSTVNDMQDAKYMSSFAQTSKQCNRMQLNTAGIKKGWTLEQLPTKTGRVMGEMVLTPDGKVVILNGANTGVAGYGNVHDMVGQSNARNPAFAGLVYDPLGSGSKRWQNLPASKIARMYHSVATIAADGSILIAGSNPNADVTSKTYHTEYAIENLSPPYMTQTRPSFKSGVPAKMAYGKTTTVKVKWPTGTRTTDISIVLMDFGFRTHGVAIDQRLVELKITRITKGGQITFENPSNGNMYPPGIGYLFVVTKGVPSIASKLIVGTGADPPYDAKAHANMLKKTTVVRGTIV